MLRAVKARWRSMPWPQTRFQRVQITTEAMEDITLQPAASPIEVVAHLAGVRSAGNRTTTEPVHSQPNTRRSAPRSSSMPQRHSESDDRSPPKASGRSAPISGEGAAAARTALQTTLKGAAAGDEQAWATLVNIYSPRVFGLIRAQCQNADLAEEITQSTFCTVVSKIGGYTELGKFEQWLFRIAMNRLRDEMRRRKRQARPVEDEALVVLADSAGPSTSGESTRIEPAEIAALRNAVAQLSDADQQIIHLRHYGELSFKQIAEILDQPLGTVLARQHRALKKLQEILGVGMGLEHE